MLDSVLSEQIRGTYKHPWFGLDLTGRKENKASKPVTTPLCKMTRLSDRAGLPVMSARTVMNRVSIGSAPDGRVLAKRVDLLIGQDVLKAITRLNHMPGK